MRKDCEDRTREADAASGPYRDALFEHYRNPRRRGALAGATHQAEGSNPLCGDSVTVRALVRQGCIEDIRFEARGCAVCIAAASVMCEAAAGKPVAEALDLAEKIGGALRGGGDWRTFATAADLAALEGIRQFPARVNCALLCLETLRKALAPPASRRS